MDPAVVRNVCVNVGLAAIAFVDRYTPPALLANLFPCCQASRVLPVGSPGSNATSSMSRLPVHGVSKHVPRLVTLIFSTVVEAGSPFTPVNRYNPATPWGGMNWPNVESAPIPIRPPKAVETNIFVGSFGTSRIFVITLPLKAASVCGLLLASL